MHKTALNFQQSWHNGEYLNQENMPTKIFAEPNVKIPRSEVIFRIIDGYLLFSQKSYKVIKKFHLGKTHFSQVYIYDIETEEQLSNTPYYFINIAETRNFLNLTESQGIRGSMYEPESLDRFISEPKDNDIILNNEANECDIDLWHDPILYDSLFFSDRLTQALLAAGFTTQQLALIRCRVV